MTLVVDGSAIAELLLGRPVAAVVARRLREHAFDLHAPHLLDLEILSALRRLVDAGDATAERAAQVVADFLDLPIERYAHQALAPRIWALRANFSPYDAAYAALAEVITERGATLLTTDTRLARATRAHTGVRVAVAEPRSAQ